MLRRPLMLDVIGRPRSSDVMRVKGRPIAGLASCCCCVVLGSGDGGRRPIRGAHGGCGGDGGTTTIVDAHGGCDGGRRPIDDAHGGCGYEQPAGSSACAPRFVSIREVSFELATNRVTSPSSSSVKLRIRIGFITALSPGALPRAVAGPYGAL